VARVGIFGAGWVGLVTGTCFAELGHEVVIRDIVPEKIDALQNGEIPFHEAEVPELLHRNRDRLAFTLDVNDVADCEFLFVCVDTPPTYSGDADLSRVWTVVDELPALGGRPILVMKSTVPVGTGEKVRHGLDARGLTHVAYVSNPEFLSEGRAVRDFMNPDRIVVGAFEAADADAVATLYDRLDCRVVRCDVNSAEMIKLAANAFLMTRISFINEIANVCEATGADVVKVAEGVGLDHRLGPHFLRAGIGYGGSCLDGRETVVVRLAGRTSLTTLERLYGDLDGRPPVPLEALAWDAGTGATAFHPVAAVTRREFDGEIVDLRTKMGRRLSCTPDHPFVTRLGVKTADELTTEDWLPVAQTTAPAEEPHVTLNVLDGLAAAGADRADVIVRAPTVVSTIGAAEMRRRLPEISPGRRFDIRDRGTLRLPEARRLRVPLGGASVGTTRNGTSVPVTLAADERFWRVVGLYLAEGHCTVDNARHRLQWSFPTDEADLVEEVRSFWADLGVKADVRRRATATSVTVSSRLLAGWWLGVLGLGANSYDHRLPDLVWDAPQRHKHALLSGLWRGDGSWSFVARGPSVVLEYGTVSRELVDGVLRLLGELGVMARLKVGRTAKSTVDTYRLVVSRADDVEGLLEFVRGEDRDVVSGSLARQSKRIASTAYERSDGSAWVRITELARRPFKGFVYSLEVPGRQTFVTTGGLITHNCFPKDSLALKQLASNSGYHFQLLSAVIEVNELQKRRVIGKLKKHLSSLRGKKIALLGLAFKPNTDDMREAPSIVLASRLLAEGAEVRAWDPVANGSVLPRGVQVVDSVLEAVRGADAAVIVTEWAELRDLASDEVRATMARPLIVDGRNVLDPAEARAAGFAYEGMGRPTSPLDVLPETRERDPELR
jgi:UDPglucose 6-dehydrogenase